MAQPQFGTAVPTKLSFAKIAAMPAPNMAPALPNIIRDSRSRPVVNSPQSSKANGQTTSPHNSKVASKEEPETNTETLITKVDNLTLTPNNALPLYIPPARGGGDSTADDQSQISSSSLKQQSFDTKSLASVTTFALDEKESIRPDDSASVRAVDEDDIHPGLSRNSSFQHENESHPVSSKTNVRTLGPSVTIAARRYPYTTLTNPPRFGDLPIGPMPDIEVPQPRVSAPSSTSMVDEGGPRPVLPVNTPDEKLIEALSSPKDRLPLLQLEEKLIAFINTGRETALELPPQNSFTRLLTHKLADYYNLAHHINDENNSVRIFRSNFCPLPIALAEIARSVPVGPQQLSHATQVKIMRRVQLSTRQFSAGNSTAASSSVPSKTTSENGAETNSEEGLQSPAEGTPNKDRSKLTREEREAQYKAARDRIFGDFHESIASERGSNGDRGSTAGEVTNMSRSSSSSGKKKNRRQKVLEDDSFEARSAFIPSYVPMNMQPTYQQVYHDVQFSGGHGSGSYSPSTYNGSGPASYSTFDPNHAYSQQLGPNSANNGLYGHIVGWQNQQQPSTTNFYHYQSPQPFQQQSIHPSADAQYAQTPPPTLPQSPNWMSNQHQPMYLQTPSSSNSSSWQPFNSTNVQNAIPYQYGQLPHPTHAGGVPYANQHPLPGSFTSTKSLFNPQTRSFVPSTTSGRGGGRGGRKKGQGPGSTRTSGASSPAVSSLSEGIPAKPKEDSLQQKYGTPANLPKKPPPSAVSPHFNSDQTTSNPNGPLVVNGNGKT